MEELVGVIVVDVGERVVDVVVHGLRFIPRVKGGTEVASVLAKHMFL